jgi:glutamine amidotransferase-like uncharacterized protein
MLQGNNPFPPIRIACLSGRGLYSRDLLFMLHGLFMGCPITQINHHHLTKSHLSAYNLLVLPGIVGEESPYPDLIPQSKKVLLQELVEDGLVIWGECAAAYYMLSSMEYRCRNGVHKNKRGLGLVEGEAIGPAYHHKTRAQREFTATNDIVLARLQQSEGGSLTRVFDINGPALYPADDKNTRVFMRYADIDGSPAAGFTHSLGRGLLMGISVHPEITPATIGTSPPLRILFEKAHRHNASRLDFLASLRQIVVQHLNLRERVPC